MIATKPLRSKNIYSEFSISKFMSESKPMYIVRSKENIIYTAHCTCLRNAKKYFRKRYPSEKILTVKKLK